MATGLSRSKAPLNPEDPQAQMILNAIVRHAASIWGTRPFWNGKRTNLENYVRTLKTPALFLTFSPADYHWDSVYRHMPNYEQCLVAELTDRIGIGRIHILENPYISAYHFHKRFGTFMKYVIKRQFDVIDRWIQYEWQGRFKRWPKNTSTNPCYKNINEFRKQNATILPKVSIIEQAWP